ncbi:DUF6056 family protein [Streptomyces sp. CAU 1734]|uniref:DUF6056 family protein n=1 Tax=Streptomyces sp. CAU 1734 TaxID=3140360 RepID=UPI003260931D
MATGTSAPAPAEAPAARRDSAAPRRFWPLALAILPLGLLALASWYGRHTRPSADEWCFIPQVRDDGILGLVSTFYLTDNGRVANGLLVGLYTKFPVAGHQWYGPVSGALMLGLLWALVAVLLRRARVTVPRGVPLLVAAMVCAAFLLATPNTYKTFYWPAASVSHTLAPVLCAAAAIPLLRGRGRGGRITALAVVAGAGVFMGTLSEEASVVSLVALAAVVLCAPVLLAGRLRRYARVWALAGMAGVTAGTLILITSPGSRNRRTRYDAESVSMLAPESLWGSLVAYREILTIVLGTWQYAGAVAAGVLLGLLARRESGRERVLLPPRPGVVLPIGAAVLLVSGYLCTVITYPVFGAAVVRAERTWNDYLLLFVLLLTAAGAFIGRALRHGPLGRRGGGTLAAGAALVCAASVAGLAPPLMGLGERMEVRAAAWDRQDARLHAAAARGETVMPYTPTRVGLMLEPFAANGRRTWPAQCVADYYNLERVTRGG